MTRARLMRLHSSPRQTQRPTVLLVCCARSISCIHSHCSFSRIFPASAGTQPVGRIRRAVSQAATSVERLPGGRIITGTGRVAGKVVSTPLRVAAQGLQFANTAVERAAHHLIGRPAAFIARQTIVRPAQFIGSTDTFKWAAKTSVGQRIGSGLSTARSQWTAGVQATRKAAEAAKLSMQGTKVGRAALATGRVGVGTFKFLGPVGGLGVLGAGISVRDMLKTSQEYRRKVRDEISGEKYG